MPDSRYEPIMGPDLQTPEDAFGPGCNAPSAADLHRYFCGPYCPKCGWVEGEPLHRSPDLCQHGEPDLHTRCPETRVKHMAWFEGGFISEDEMGLRHVYTEEEAADLLVMGTLKPIPLNSLPAFVRVVIELMKELSITMPEAVASAAHRMKDNE